MSAPEGVTNPAVRAAVEAFAAAPGPAASIEVLRHCLYGELLFDGTGSDVRTDGGAMAAGSTIRIATGTGPDGASALFAFTSQAEIARVHEPGTEVISFVQPAASVLEFARSNGHEWLYVDPAGPTCALSGGELDFALRVPRNDAVRAALEPGNPREELIAALRADGTLLVAVEPSPDLPADGVITEEIRVQLRVSGAPGGTGSALLAFTSGPELVARHLQDQIVTLPTAEVLDRARAGGHVGIVLNAAGPWAFVPVAEF